MESETENKRLRKEGFFQKELMSFFFAILLVKAFILGNFRLNKLGLLPLLRRIFFILSIIFYSIANTNLITSIANGTFANLPTSDPCLSAFERF
jgi:hypothetical protein